MYRPAMLVFPPATTLRSLEEGPSLAEILAEKGLIMDIRGSSTYLPDLGGIIISCVADSSDDFEAAGGAIPSGA